MKFTALTTSLPTDTPSAIATLADLGFRWVDTPPVRDEASRRAIAERGLSVACVGLEKEQPVEIDAASEDAGLRKRAVAYYERAIEATAELEAPIAYFIPPATPDALPRWSDSLLQLADFAATQQVRIGVEHFPRRALPTVAETLRFLDAHRHPSLALLIDVGHCLISGEDPARAIREAGSWFGYLHFDDNDGVDDLHWPLLRGVLTKETLRDVLVAQAEVGYQGGLCLELHPELDDPTGALREGLALLRACAESS